ncbi:MAG: FAD binding domain-containing protein [Beijerinckiaceae bacterium]
MKAAPFKYVRPETLNEALSILAQHGDDVRIMAGGQSLGAMLNMRIVTPKILLDLNRLDELSAVNGRVTGAMVRQRDALDHAPLMEAVPLLAQALPTVGHYQTRNRGTLGGSVAHADPSAEIPLVLATLGASVELKSKRRTRKMSAAEFFRSTLLTARQPDEVLTALHWPAIAPTARTAFYEFAVRDGDFAIVAVACVLDPQTGLVRLGFGGCGETPQIVEKTGIDAKKNDDLVDEAVSELDYHSDLLASAAYRKQLAGVLARRSIERALNRESVRA